jgi:hypothetical protein
MFLTCCSGNRALELVRGSTSEQLWEGLHYPLRYQLIAAGIQAMHAQDLQPCQSITSLVENRRLVL